MKHSLLCTYQVRLNGIIVENAPITKQSKQLIFLPQDNSNNIYISFPMHEPVQYVSRCKPTKFELDMCDQVTLTSFERWDPDLFLTEKSNKLSELYETHDDI